MFEGSDVLTLTQLERCTGIAWPHVRFLPEGPYSCIFRACSWLGLNLYRIFRSNFQSTKTLQLLILSSEMPKNLDI
jgi:hypothetical protein